MSTPSPCLRVSVSPCLFFALGAVAAVALGWVGAAFSLASKAPVGVVSVGIGVALGLLLVGLAQMLRVSQRRVLLLGAVVLAIVTTLSQHGWLYRAYCGKWRQDRIDQPAVALFRPETEPLSVVAYFRRELNFAPSQAMLWIMDGALIVAAAVGVIIVSQRREK
jgi:hypothetical protein